MSGRVGDLSQAQQLALTEIKRAMSDVLKPEHDDYLLLQFLRARRFDLKKTEEMFRRHLQFRKEFPEDYMLNEYQPPELLVKHLLPPLLGYDKEGCPIRCIQIGRQDIKGVVCSVRRPEVRKCVTYVLDQDKKEMRKRSIETGIHIETRTFIFDLEGLSFRQIYHKEVYDLVISFLKLYECNYPENLKIAFIINTPSFFSFLFNMVKTLLSEDTVQKIKIYGYSGWKEELLNFIDADVLPVVYGGTRTDPDGDPKCPSLIREFNPIPKEFYLKNQNRLDPEDADVHKVSIGRRSKHSVPLRVDVPGCTMSWEVECRNNDIHVHLLQSEASGSTIQVLESMIVNSEYGSKRGCHLAEKAGKYTLVLDNSHSLLRSKVVLYKAGVTSLVKPNSTNNTITNEHNGH